MSIEERFETIKEFTCLSPQEKRLVLEEYMKGEHPYQIEYQIWTIIITAILLGAAEYVLRDKLQLDNFELCALFFIALTISYFISMFIQSNWIAPKVLKKIIFNLDKIKKASKKRFFTDLR